MKQEPSFSEHTKHTRSTKINFGKGRRGRRFKIVERYNVTIVRSGDTIPLTIGKEKASIAKNMLKMKSNITQDHSKEEHVVLMVTTNEEEFIAKNWFLETGCSNHMTGHIDWISNFDTSETNEVRLADGNVIEAVGIKDIVIKKNVKEITVIESVLYVPKIKCNLLNVG